MNKLSKGTTYGKNFYKRSKEAAFAAIPIADIQWQNT